MSLFATTTRSPTMSLQVGRQARSAADNFFESPVLSNIVQEAVNLKCVSSLTGPLPRRRLSFVLS